MQEYLLELYGLYESIHVAGSAAWIGGGIAETESTDAVGYAAWRAAELAAEMNGGGNASVARNAVWDLAHDSAKYAAKDAVKAVKEDDLKIRGMEAARASLKYIITNEEEIAEAIRNQLKTIKLGKSIDYKSTFDRLLKPSLTKMNLGGRCWYMAKVLRLMKMSNYCERNKMISIKYDNEEVNKFILWIIGVEYSTRELYFQVNLPMVLVRIIHDYLLAPSWERVREEVLKMI